MAGKGVNFNISARNGTGPALRGVVGGLRSVRREMYTGQPLMKSWNAGLNSNRRAVQQLGFQVGDFATQIAGGQSAMLAFTQQGGQMLQFFGPMGAVMAALLAVFGSLTIAIQRSGGSLVALAPALMLTSDQIRMIADAWHWLGQSLLTVANLIVNHLGMIMGAAAAVAVFFIGKWVASMIAAAMASKLVSDTLLIGAMVTARYGTFAGYAAMATHLFRASLVLLRTVLMTLGIGLLLVTIGWLTEAFMRVAKSTGGFMGALRALGDLATAVFDYMVAQASTLPERLQIVWNWIAAGFMGMVNSLRLAWYKFLVGMSQSALGAGMDDLAAKLGGAAESVGQAVDAANESMGAYSEANEKLRRSIAGKTSGAADEVVTAWERIKTAWKEGASAIDLGDMFGGSGAGDGGGGAKGKAEKEAKDIETVFDNMRKAVGESILSSFKSLLKGTTSIKDALLSILGSILDKIMDIIATPVFDSISGALSGAILGGIGISRTMAMPSFAGGGFTWSGPRSGGVDGKGGRLAVLHSDETVTDHRAGGSTGGTVINMTINTPDAASFQASRRQIMQQMQSAVK